MCTLTYIPQGDNSFILTQNRDEQAKRSPKTISREQFFGQHLIFPRDSRAGGTWIVASHQDRVVCMLNGAFERHQHRPPYRRSRGLMALDFFAFAKIEHFFKAYEVQGMEPFLMVAYDRGRLVEFRWDGQQKYFKELNITEKYIWSSATLYDASMQVKRKSWFLEWCVGRSDFSEAAILDFHQTGGEGDPHNDFIMNRYNIVQTVSITQIIKTASTIDMRYIDLLHKQEQIEQLLLVS